MKKEKKKYLSDCRWCPKQLGNKKICGVDTSKNLNGARIYYRKPDSRCKLRGD